MFRSLKRFISDYVRKKWIQFGGGLYGVGALLTMFYIRMFSGSDPNLIHLRMALIEKILPAWFQLYLDIFVSSILWPVFWLMILF